MKHIELSEKKHLTLAAVREALRNGDDIVLCDAGEPLVRLVSVAAEQKARKDFFTHYPHDPAECFNSCWRHDGSAEAEAQGLVGMAKDEVAAEPVAAA
jgi:antitoxin (DNA-binding transcriptional repressor) of toxin-antitoxin stability system